MSTSYRLFRPIAGTCFLISFLCSSLTIAYAQDNEFLDEIIVSVRKIEEGIQKVPVAVQVLTGEAHDRGAIRPVDRPKLVVDTLVAESDADLHVVRSLETVDDYGHAPSIAPERPARRRTRSRF